MAEVTQPAMVLSATDLTPLVRQLIVLPKAEKFSYQPGQWVSVKLPVGPKPPLNRAYSMATPATSSGELTLVFDRVPGGLGSGYLSHLKTGDEIQLSGPYGNFLLPQPLTREVVLIARYTGLVPIRCILKSVYARRENSPILLIAVGPDESELLYHEEFLSLAVMHPSFRYLPLVASSDDSAASLTMTMLRPLVEGSAHLLPMICGTKEFVRPLRAFFTESGYERKEVKAETYD
jgi:ferredoxin-NADP reductase